MTRLLLHLSLISVVTGQFVFFGGNRRPARPLVPQRVHHLPPMVTQGSRGTGRLVSPSASSRPRGNFQYLGKNFLVTWRMSGNDFDWAGGVRYCKSQNMELISLDTKEKAEHFLNLVSRDRAQYFWTGGEVSSNSQTLTWPSGKSESIARGQHPWSFTGRTGPQPDGGERCVAVLNNVYRDGAKFHDVACHHRKPVVCEEV